MPSVAATAACCGLRPVANAFGELSGMMYTRGIGRPARCASRATVAYSGCPAPTSCARYIRRTILSEKKYDTKLVPAAKRNASSRPCAPPSTSPMKSSSALSAAEEQRRLQCVRHGCVRAGVSRARAWRQDAVHRAASGSAPTDRRPSSSRNPRRRRRNSRPGAGATHAIRPAAMAEAFDVRWLRPEARTPARRRRYNRAMRPTSASSCFRALSRASESQHAATGTPSAAVRRSPRRASAGPAGARRQRPPSSSWACRSSRARSSSGRTMRAGGSATTCSARCRCWRRWSRTTAPRSNSAGTLCSSVRPPICSRSAATAPRRWRSHRA